MTDPLPPWVQRRENPLGGMRPANISARQWLGAGAQEGGGLLGWPRTNAGAQHARLPLTVQS